jgi:hypothetical protein
MFLAVLFRRLTMYLYLVFNETFFPFSSFSLLDVLVIQ